MHELRYNFFSFKPKTLSPNTRMKNVQPNPAIHDGTMTSTTAHSNVNKMNPSASYKCLMYRRTHGLVRVQDRSRFCRSRSGPSLRIGPRRGSSQATPLLRVLRFSARKREGTAVSAWSACLLSTLPTPGECATARLFGFCDDWTAHTLLSFRCTANAPSLRSVLHGVPSISSTVPSDVPYHKLIDVNKIHLSLLDYHIKMSTTWRKRVYFIIKWKISLKRNLQKCTKRL